MKIAISGKGGAGKTTLTALLSRALAAQGRRVLAADADPDPNLAFSLGYPTPDAIRPIVECTDLIRERTGAEPGVSGGMFTLNPRVDDIPGTHSVDCDGVKLIVLGAMTRGGGGCACPENTFLKSLLNHLVMGSGDVVFVDLPAGVEPMGRATARAVDLLLIVMDHTPASLRSGARIAELAAQLKIPNVGAVGNRADDEEQIRLISSASPVPVLASLPTDPGLRRSPVAPELPATRAAIAKLLDIIGTMEKPG